MKTALVTGASRGIGAAAALALAEDGYRVIVNYNNSKAEAEALAQKIGGMAIRADVSEKAQVREMFSVCGGVDVLVCNAGIACSKLFTDTSDDEWDHIFAVNVGGTKNCIQAALPHMLREKAGNIVTVSSIWGITGASCEAAYSASKAAIIGLSKALAKELGPSGIRVNCVAPGVIDTDMNAKLTATDIAALADETPLGTLGSSADVAEAVRFLVSDKARFITGEVMNVNGGLLI